jgi:hypothetical protein
MNTPLVLTFDMSAFEFTDSEAEGFLEYGYSLAGDGFFYDEYMVPNGPVKSLAEELVLCFDKFPDCDNPLGVALFAAKVRGAVWTNLSDYASEIYENRGMVMAEWEEDEQPKIRAILNANNDIARKQAS